MLQVGIVGLPNVGKSTLFKTLTKKQVPCENFPFCTIEPNVGVVEVPDDRLHQLARVSQSEKIIPTAIEFVDIAGIVKGAHKGEGLGNKFLANIREVDMIVHVVRAFQDPNVIHVDGTVDPVRDAETIEIELAMADLETVQKRLDAVRKMSRGAGSLPAGRHGRLAGKGEGATEENTIVGGASIGANLAIGFLVAHPGTKLALALSPGLNYRGVTTDGRIKKLHPGQKVVLVASDDDDRDSAESCRELHRLNPEQTVLIEKKGLGHGTTMFEKDSKLMDELLKFIP